MDTINKNISVNDILLKLSKKPMEMDEFLSVERYFNALRESFLIDLINVSDFYNKDIYDFYFIIEDTSKNWAKKLILKKTMVDLIIKYRVIDFLIIRDYKNNDLELIKND
jgi:hypothetical protein